MPRSHSAGQGTALALLLFGAFAAVASAQPTTLYLSTPAPWCTGVCTGTIATVDPDTPAITRSVAVPASQSFRGLYVTPDGRFTVSTLPDEAGGSAPGWLVLRDVVTGRIDLLPVPPDNAIIVGHPRRPELYLRDQGGAFALSAAGVRPFASTPCGARMAPVATSGNGDRVLYQCLALPIVSVLFDTATGELVATFTSAVRALSVDGRETYSVEANRVVRRDVATNTVLADAAIPPGAFGQPEPVSALLVDARSGRVFVLGSFVNVFDGTSLALVRSTFAPWYAQYGGLRSLTFDPDRPRAYATSSQIVEPGYYYGSYHVIDTDTGLPVGGVSNVPLNTLEIGGFAVAPRPAAPTAVTATVSSAAALLTWTPGVSNAQTTRYVIDVGSAPGLSNIFSGLDIGLQTSFSASGVPPGTYYVRVRAANYTGLSAASDEIIVTVP